MKKGFTLIELLVVVLIIGILSAVALPQYTQAVEKSRAAEPTAMLGTVRYAAERYRLQTGSWPTSLDVLDIEVPTSSTFDYAIATGAAATDTYFVFNASRKASSGHNYVLSVSVDANGNAKRFCGQATAKNTQTGVPTTGDDLKICKAITSKGTPTDGTW